MTLREAIEQAISLGETDPAVIAGQVISRYGEQVVFSEFDAQTFAADVARRLIGSQRRSGIRALARMDTATKRDLMLHMVWLPGHGWWKLGDFTLDDWSHFITVYRKGARALDRYADWGESQRELQAAQGVEFFRQVKGALPALPPAEEAA